MATSGHHLDLKTPQGGYGYQKAFSSSEKTDFFTRILELLSLFVSLGNNFEQMIIESIAPNPAPEIFSDLS